MMRGERRFGGDIRVRSPPRRNYSPPRRQAATKSPTRAGTRGNRDYPRNPRTRSPPRVSMPRWETLDYLRNPRTGSPPSVSMPRREAWDYPRNPRIGSPPPGSRPSGETRDFSRPQHGLRKRRSDVSSDMEKSRSDYGRHSRPSQKLSQFNDGLSQGDSPSMKFQWEHIFGDSKGMNGNANHSSKHYTDYGIGTTFTRVTTERSYQTSGLADIGRSGTRLEKLMPMEVERGSNFRASYTLESGTRRGSETNDGGLPLQSQKFLNTGLHKTEDLRFQDQMPAADDLIARDLYQGEEFSNFSAKPTYYSRDTSRCVIPSSHSEASSTVPFGRLKDDFHDSHGDGFPAHSDGFSRSSGMLTDPIPREPYTHISSLKSSRDPLMQLNDTTKYSQAVLTPEDGTRGGYTYPDVRRSEKGEMASLSDKHYGKMAGVQDDYGHIDSLGFRRVKPIKDRIVVTEGSRREDLIQGMPWDAYSSSLERPISNYLDASGSGSLYASKKDGEASDYRSMHHEYDHDVYGEHGNNYTTEDHGYGRDAGLQHEDGILNMSSMTDYDLGLEGIDNNIQGGFTEEELDLIERPKRMLKRKLDDETELTRKNPRSKFSNRGKISGTIHNAISRKSVFSTCRYKNIGGTINGVGRRNSNPIAYAGLSRSPWQLKSNGRDIKKRLGPEFRDINRRLGPIGPVPQHSNSPRPSAKKRKLQKFLKSVEDGDHESIHAEKDGPSEGKVPPAKPEPLEESEEFKQLVHSTFFKFVKQLNESPGQRRRLTKQGKAGSLKCGVCGRDSEEFVDTESLALHACMAPKVGLRAQHLGFHKAICSLMGWKNAEILDSQWVCQLLPDAETVAIKEDLIIWPPFVVIQNSSMGNISPDGRVRVTVEMLEGILREMGFGEKTTACQGKPANQSTMVVKFSGTISGFHEAEKLHKIYADNNRGRTEFQSINPNNIQNASASNIEQFLYAYLGTAEDLDKLDFGTKKRCIVRSKKEIHKIADAPLKIE